MSRFLSYLAPSRPLRRAILARRASSGVIFKPTGLPFGSFQFGGHFDRFRSLSGEIILKGKKRGFLEDGMRESSKIAQTKIRKARPLHGWSVPGM